ncbi:MAG: hypothetical protein Q8L26_01940 [Candidatus Omnitrophota bacterium]|nr:hypothetical protein [Candidatus Omnitrophota bacterium]
MAITRQDVHTINNLLNKITITCGGIKDMLETEALDKLPAEKLRQLSVELIKGFSDIEQAAMDISNIAFKI